VAGDVFEQQQPAGAQHAGDLADRAAPVGDVVDDAELDDGIDAAGGLMDVARVADGQ